jgi:hypothetical protein
MPDSFLSPVSPGVRIRPRAAILDIVPEVCNRNLGRMGNRVQPVVLGAARSLLVVFAWKPAPETPPIRETKSGLLSEWARTLGLPVDRAGRLVKRRSRMFSKLLSSSRVEGDSIATLSGDV